MKLILDWAWDRVVDIKDQLDQLCKNFILDHHNSLLIDSFKRMKREFTAHFSKIIPYWKFHQWQLQILAPDRNQICKVKKP